MLCYGWMACSDVCGEEVILKYGNPSNLAVDAVVWPRVYLADGPLTGEKMATDRVSGFIPGLCLTSHRRTFRQWPVQDRQGKQAGT